MCQSWLKYICYLSTAKWSIILSSKEYTRSPYIIMTKDLGLRIFLLFYWSSLLKWTLYFVQLRLTDTHWRNITGKAGLTPPASAYSPRPWPSMDLYFTLSIWCLLSFWNFYNSCFLELSSFRTSYTWFLLTFWSCPNTMFSENSSLFTPNSVFLPLPCLLSLLFLPKSILFIGPCVSVACVPYRI